MDFQSIAQKSQADSQSQVTPTPDLSLSPSLSLNPGNDPDLRAVLDTWPTLPGDVRKMIAGVVKATVEAGAQRK